MRTTTTDGAAEESEIRRAVDGLAEIRAPRFQPGQRLLTVDADASAIEAVMAVNRQAGFDPRPGAAAA